ncbi:hypothetical protein V490_00270, partial [Pseudogymnoascus sp. VKM F-3557]
MKLTSTMNSELGRQDQRDSAAISRSILESYEPLEFGKRRSTSTKVLTDELYTPDEVDVKWYARIKSELKERQNRRIKEGTMVETEFKTDQTLSTGRLRTVSPTSLAIFIKMVKRVYETFTPDQVTDDMLRKAATLFNENYGTWGPLSHKPGKPVTLSIRQLREQYLPNTAESSYIRVTVDGNLAGNAFICRWKCRDNIVCWVTQLVVGKAYREQGLATGLLRSLREDRDDIYSIMSSHPGACLAAGKSFGTTIETVPLNYIRKEADAVMKSSPIVYVRDAKLCGTIFDPNDSTGLVSGVNTSFFVSHDEPLEALEV